MTDTDARDDLARMVPGPVERDLPGDRRHHLQEFVMSEIQRDPRPARPRPSVRRPVLVTAALTAAAAVAAVVGVAATGGTGDSPTPPGRTQAAVSGPDLLLAAATTTQRQPDETGTYWYVKLVSTEPTAGGETQREYWYHRDGRAWQRNPESGDRAVMMPSIRGYWVGAPSVRFQKIQDLPTTPDALKAWIADAFDIAGPPNADEKQYVLYGLVALVTQVPAPQKVRAAAFQALAAYPNVTRLGPVDGGEGLRISIFEDTEVRLVIDPATAKVTRTTFGVAGEGLLYVAGEGGSMALTTRWTDTLPL